MYRACGTETTKRMPFCKWRSGGSGRETHLRCCAVRADLGSEAAGSLVHGGIKAAVAGGRGGIVALGLRKTLALGEAHALAAVKAPEAQLLGRAVAKALARAHALLAAP